VVRADPHKPLIVIDGIVRAEHTSVAEFKEALRRELLAADFFNANERDSLLIRIK
jgi:hypothetical protein